MKLCSRLLWAILALGITGLAQDAAVSEKPDQTTRVVLHDSHVKDDENVMHDGVPDKRILGVLPNYRTAEDHGPYQPITSRQKLRIAYKDSFDWPGLVLSAAFAGLYQLEDSNPDFGQGLKGYGHRYATAFGDQVIGNILAEGILPSLLHEDPRYFRRVSGSKKSRAGYALTRIFVTRTDAGKNRLNFSEIVGNSSAVAISNLYYPQSRNFNDNVQKLGVQLSTDAFSNVLKEFWPDIKHHYFHKKHE